jgi:hypothetical protein
MSEVEIRISRALWELLTEEQQAAVKTLSQKYAYDFGYDLEWEFFWIRFTPENWLLANLTEAELFKHFRQFNG